MRIVIGRPAGRRQAILLLGVLTSSVILGSACTGEYPSLLPDGADGDGGEVLGYQPVLPAETGGADPAGGGPSLSEIPVSPSDLQAAAATDGAIQLTWADNSDNEEGFRIDRLASGEWVEYATTGSGVTAFIDRAVVPQTVFCYRVAAFGAGGMSEFTSAVCSALPVVSELDPADALLNAMRALPPLPKLHYCSALEWGGLMTQAGDPRLVEYIRVTHAAGVAGEWVRSDQIQALVNACREVNSNAPSIPASLAINYSVWHRVFPADALPTDPDNGEIDEFRRRMTLVKGYLQASNAVLGADIRVSALLFDCERFFIRTDSSPQAAEYNAAIVAKYDAAYAAAKDLFPDADVHWLLRGDPYSPHFTRQERGDSYDTTLFYLPDLDYVRYLYQRTYDRLRSDESIYPGRTTSLQMWLSLGCGYQFLPDGTRPWVWDLDYDLGVSWQIGAEMNQLQYTGGSEHWERLSTICFYPRPFDERAPGWPRHFIAYVQGANGMPLDVP